MPTFILVPTPKVQAGGDDSKEASLIINQYGAQNEAPAPRELENPTVTALHQQRNYNDGYFELRIKVPEPNLDGDDGYDLDDDDFVVDLEAGKGGHAIFQDGALIETPAGSGPVAELCHAYTASLAQEHVKAIALQPPISLHWGIKLLSFISAFGAASKAFAGTSKFFADPQGALLGLSTYAGETPSYVLGVLSAAPSIAFYLRSLLRIRTQAKAKTIKRNSDQVNDRNISDHIKAALLRQLFPQLDFSTSTKQEAADDILGAFYSCGNVGMVIANYPSLLSYPVLYEVVIACIAWTNLSVGIDKSHKITSDLGIGQVKDPLDLSAQLRTEVDQLYQAMQCYSKLTADLTEQEVAVDGFKAKQEGCSSISALIAIYETELSRLQALHNAKRADSGDARTKSLVCRVQFPVQNKAGKFAHLFAKFSSAITAGGAVASNIDGIEHLVAKLFTGIGAAGLYGPIFGYVLGFVGSLSAIGLNKYDTDALVEKVFGLFVSKLEIELNTALKKDSSMSWETLLSGATGYIWSALGATAGIYFTKQAIDKMKIFESGPFMHGLGQYFVYATGALMTTTKGHPTADGIRKICNALRCCSNQTTENPKKNAEIVAYQDQLIATLLCNIKDTIVEYNDLPERRRKLEGETHEINPSKYSTALDEKIKNLQDESRAAIIELLRAELNWLRNPLDAGQYPARVDKGSIQIKDNNCCYAPCLGTTIEP